MDIRYSTNPEDFKKYTTADIRKEFLIETLFRPDEVIATYSHVDRMVAVGCMPVNEVVPIDKGIDCWANFGTHYFLERREVGIFNVGTGSGKIVADGTTYEMGPKDCLYITMGTKSPLHLMMLKTRLNTIWFLHRPTKPARPNLFLLKMPTNVPAAKSHCAINVLSISSSIRM